MGANAVRTEEGDADLEGLRERIGAVNMRLLDLLSQRAHLVERVRDLKERHGLEMYSPGREIRMLESVVAANPGPFPDGVVRHLFQEIFRASLDLMERSAGESLLVARRPGDPDVVVQVRGHEIGRAPVVIAGPCSIEGPEQLDAVAASLAALGIGFLRGGAFKPRTSPYAFQGLGEPALAMLESAGRRHGMVTVTEVVDTRTVELTARHADILQVGSRNMANFELLKAVAGAGRPVLLKRGFAATLDEFLQAAEYLALAGNRDIILCERGIRSFGRETRYTLDISAIPLLRQSCRLPILVDVSHAAGRRDILVPLARAALAAGAHGIMVEVHPTPHLARSDSQQQLDLEQFAQLYEAVRPLLQAPPAASGAGAGDAA